MVAAGSSRLYEDPDIDEYESMDDLGYNRRTVHNQQDFIMHQLDLLQDNDVEPYLHSNSQQYDRNDSVLSSSGSSSASLSSPGMSSCKQHPPHTASSHDNSQQQDQQLARTSTSNSIATGDAAWDSGPAGIVFAEPVTTPTKDSRRNSIGEQQPCLSRVESLSNSFIDELESCDGNGDPSRLSEADSISGDLGTPPRHSRATAGGDGSSAAPSGRTTADYDDVIDLSPPSPPPDCAADAGIDLSNIFELGLRGGSRTSSVDVLYGSVRGWSEADSEAGAADHRPRSQGTAAGNSSRSAPGLLGAAVAGAAASRHKPDSARQSTTEQLEQPVQQQEALEQQELVRQPVQEVQQQMAAEAVQSEQQTGNQQQDQQQR